MAQLQHNYIPPPHRSHSPVSPLLQTDFPLPSSRPSAQLHHLRGDGATGDADDLTRSPIRTMSRSPSISSFSTNSAWANQPATPSNIYPLPAYVAAFGASQVVSESKRHYSDDEDERNGVGISKPQREDMQFSSAALALLNAFLDQLLYGMLGHARSTTLTALRPAVAEVLRLRLAHEAIASAEEELSELLAGGDEEEDEMNQQQTEAERNRMWDTELVWKRTRLRVMVYIRLGEMEDDDEQRYVREDDLLQTTSERRFSHSTGLVSWAAAIFLTSVLEFVAEQVLRTAAQAAENRTRRQTRNPRISMSSTGTPVTPVDSGVTVEDYDMEKVALNSTLGRLWRTWRKSLRNNNHTTSAPSTPTPTNNNNNNRSNSNFSRRLSRDNFNSPQNATAMSGLRRNSFGAGSTLDESRPTSRSADDDQGISEEGAMDQELPEAQYPEHVLAANIPLPMGDEKQDVNEIEVPGLAEDPDEVDSNGTQTPVDAAPKRRHSLTGSAPPNWVSLLGRWIAETVAPSILGEPDRDEAGTPTIDKAEGEPEPTSDVGPVAEEEVNPVESKPDLEEGKPSLGEDKPAADEGKPDHLGLDERTEVAQDKPEVPGEWPEAAGENSVRAEPAKDIQPEDEAEAAKHSDQRARPVLLTRQRSSSLPAILVHRKPIRSQKKAVETLDQEPANAEASQGIGAATDETANQEDLPREAAAQKVEEPFVDTTEADDTGKTTPLVEAVEEQNGTAKDATLVEAVEEQKSAAKGATSVEVVEEQSSTAKDATSVEATEEKKSTGLLGAVAGAVAGVSTAAAAAAVAVVYGKEGHEEAESKPDIAQGDAKDKQALIDLIKSGQLDSPSDPESDGIEKRESQKHSVDVKRLGVPQAGSKRSSWSSEEPNASKRISSPPGTMIPATSQRARAESFSLDDGGEIERPIAKPRHLSEDFGPDSDVQEQFVDIGVAKTSDEAVSTPRGQTSEAYNNARDDSTNPAPQRRSRIILDPISPEGSSLLTGKETPPLIQETQASDISPQAFLNRRSLTPKVSPLQSQSPQSFRDHPRSVAATNGVQLAAANGSQTSPPEKSWRRSIPMAINGELQEPVSKQSGSTFQEKPTSKSRQPEADPVTGASLPLTSASIKGPEDFEMFVQGGDTVKYTLTPDNVRDHPSPSDGIQLLGKAASFRSVEREMAPSPIQPSPLPTVADDTRTGRSQVTKHATAASKATAASTVAYTEDTDARSSRSEKRRSISRPSARNTSAHRKSGLMAREPQVMTESTRDFADFIRSTGPSKEPEVRPLLSSRSAASLKSLNDAHLEGSRSQSPGGSTVRSMSRSHIHVQADDAPPLPSMPPSRSKSLSQAHMEPREAKTSIADGTSELIDFIRSGPNGGTAISPDEQRQHRISRTVAPFRTTMDSDLFNDWGDKIAAQPDLTLNPSLPVSSIIPSIRSGSSAKSSQRTSANSRSALLHQNNTTASDVVHPAHTGQPPQLTSTLPKTVQLVQSSPSSKTRYRNKDPYAIDFDNDDEDDDLLTALPNNSRPEESLIDFLRNSEPPKTGSVSTGDTFSNGGPLGPGIVPALKTYGADSESNGQRVSEPTREGSISKGGPVSAPPKLRTDSVGSKRFEAREAAKRAVSDTRELAEFLRSSGPPDTRPAPVIAARKAPETISLKSKSSRRGLGLFASLFSSKKDRGRAQVA